LQLNAYQRAKGRQSGNDTKPIEREVGEFEIISTLVQNQTQRNSMLVKKQV
jgi:hypothetical protein